MIHPPPSRLVLAYIGSAHVALLAAALLAWWAAAEVAQSFLHERVLACVHCITLGWLTATALGAVYALLPLVLRTPCPARWPDVLACIVVLAGGSGVVAHMLLATYSGLAWSGGMIALGAAWVLLRVWRALRTAAAPRLQKAAIPLALGFLVVAGVMGALVAIDRERGWFAGGHLRAIAAHAHVALVGWLLLLTAGIGHRLLPMLLPAHPVQGRRPACTVFALALGSVALPVTWLCTPPPACWPALAAAPIGAGLLLFVLDLAALLRRRVPRARDLPRYDPGLLLAGVGFACMAGAFVLGGAVLLGDLDHGCIALYGVLVLVGGFGSLVLGVGLRLWPIFAWMRTFSRTAAVPESTPATLPSVPLQWTAALAWLAAIALLGTGVVFHRADLARAGAVAWTAAALAANVNLAVVLVRARRSRRGAAG